MVPSAAAKLTAGASGAGATGGATTAAAGGVPADHLQWTSRGAAAALRTGTSAAA